MRTLFLAFFLFFMFEFIVTPRQGPPRHVHHREDETYYILTGEFLFEVGGTKIPFCPARPSTRRATLRTAGRTRQLPNPG
jgi:hypothetical protein